MLKIKLVDLDKMGKEPLKKATVSDIESAKGEFLEAVAAHMMNTKKYPLPLPYLHCRQVGAELDLAIWRRENKPVALVINPTFTVLDKSYVTVGTEVCSSYRYKRDGMFKVFASKRATRIVAKYDTLVDGKLVPDSEEFRGADAVAFQQMCDMSAGKLISRFEVISRKKGNSGK